MIHDREGAHASRVAILQAPITDQPTIHPTTTRIIAHVGKARRLQPVERDSYEKTLPVDEEGDVERR
jgi:hypothetical protein